MTRADLSDRAESRRALISDIERGEANPTLDSIVRITASTTWDISRSAEFDSAKGNSNRYYGKKRGSTSHGVLTMDPGDQASFL